jgi:hypothetical protein
MFPAPLRETQESAGKAGTAVAVSSGKRFSSPTRLPHALAGKHPAGALLPARYLEKDEGKDGAAVSFINGKKHLHGRNTLFPLSITHSFTILESSAYRKPHLFH